MIRFQLSLASMAAVLMMVLRFTSFEFKNDAWTSSVPYTHLFYVDLRLNFNRVIGEVAV